MIKFLQSKSVPDCEDFSVAVLEKDGLAWIVLSDSLSQKYYKFWSQRAEADSVAVDDIIVELSVRLHGIHADSQIFREVTMFWPVGWNYWGLGMPQPIADFLSYEFKDAVSEFLKLKK